MFADEGHPQPTIPREEFQAAIGGIPVQRVGRIERVLQARDTGSFDAIVERFEKILAKAAGGPYLLAFKRILVYRSGGSRVLTTGWLV